MHRIITISAILLTLLTGNLKAQQPVQCSPTLTPPYTLNLSDYSKFGSQHLVVTLTVNDLRIQNLPVKLRISFETAGITIENPVTITTTPIYISGGQTQIIFGKDLEDYFKIQNLLFKGYSKEAYHRTGQLPEGFYKISVEARHFQTNKLVSNPGTTTAWIALGKPPVLKLPVDNEELGEFKGMPLTFSWLASNVGTPMAKGSIQYKFELWEMRVPGVHPNTVAASIPVFHEHTTFNTLYSLYPASLMMEPGMKYAWRVTASDISGFVPFEQKGQSEIRTFTYKSKCEFLDSIQTQKIGSTAKFWWNAADNHSSYNVEMRNQQSAWMLNKETYDTHVNLYELDPGTYEMRIQAVCNGDASSVSDFSEWTKVSIAPPNAIIDTANCPDCLCTNDYGTRTIDNFDLKDNLQAGDTLENKSGRTRFIIKTAEPQGNGKYKGILLFWAEIWGVKIPCEFWDLSVNTDNVILHMEMESIYDPQFVLNVDSTANYFTNLWDAVGDLDPDTRIKDTLNVNEDIRTIYITEGDSVMVVTSNNDTVLISDNANRLEQTLLTDKDGDEYIINRDGDVMRKEEYKNSGSNNKKLNDYNKNKEENNLTEHVSVDFTAYTKQHYGFDFYTEQKSALQQTYQKLNNGYRPAWKSIESFKHDKVLTDNTAKNITYRNNMGVPVLLQDNTLNLQGAGEGMESALYAYYTVNDTTEKIAGKLNIASYPKDVKKLYIVPVNEPVKFTDNELQENLNTIYKQAVVEWNVELLEEIKVDNFENGNMTHGGSGALSPYNADQKKIIKTFTQENELEKDAFYLFYVNNVQGKSGDYGGYMPFKHQVGFIYDNPIFSIVAHELGHGAFNLKHTFSEKAFIAPRQSTQNLMDYANGTEIWKNQWDLIQSPENVVLAWAKDEEETEYPATNDSAKVMECLNLIRSSYIKNPKGKLNIFELGAYNRIYGNVSLIYGCSSKIMVEIGMPANNGDEILIDKEELLELDNLSGEYNYSISFRDQARKDKKYAINIQCKNVDKYLLKDFLTGVKKENLICVDEPDCGGNKSNNLHDYDRDITNILNTIRNARLNKSEIVSVPWPEYARTSIVGCNVKLFKDLDFRVVVAKKGDINNIKPDVSNMDYLSYYHPSFGDEVKNFLNSFGASFKLGKLSGEKKLRMFRYYDAENPYRELRIIVEDRYANIMGHYLYGEGWETDFTQEDRSWVLYIFSPQISRKFEAVKSQTEGNLLEQRRLTYYALTNQFPDKGISRLAGNSYSFLSKHNYAAQLKSNPFASKEGVSVYTYSYGSLGIEIAKEPIQFEILPELFQEDIYYPVDIKLWDKDNSLPSLGNTYYKEYDFRGKYQEGTFAISPPTGGGGVISGYLRGFGYNEFYYAGVGATATYTLEVSGEVGLVDGKYKGFGKPTPLNFAGPGTNITVSAGEINSPIGFALSSWQGYNDRGVQSWNGITVGLDITIGLSNVLLPANVNYMRVQTDLHFPSPNKTKKETLDILNNNSYYVGE